MIDYYLRFTRCSPTRKVTGHFFCAITTKGTIHRGVFFSRYVFSSNCLWKVFSAWAKLKLKLEIWVCFALSFHTFEMENSQHGLSLVNRRFDQITLSKCCLSVCFSSKSMCFLLYLCASFTFCFYIFKFSFCYLSPRVSPLCDHFSDRLSRLSYAKQIYLRQTLI